MNSPFARAARLLALALLLSGCSKKVTQPDASFTTPEGVAGGRVIMMGWSDQAVYGVVIGDPGTPDDRFDDTVLEWETFFFSDTTAVRFQIWDNTAANGYQVFRTSANGGLTRLYDYDVRPTRKYLFAQTDIFEFADAAPASPTSDYIGRGTFNGVVGTNSPLTNRVLPVGRIDDGLEVTFQRPVRDSILNLRWVPDARATFYVVEILDANSFKTRRANTLRSMLPSPIISDSRIPNIPFIVMASETPALVLPFYPAIFPVRLFIRISAYDAAGRMVSRNNQDVTTFTRDVPPSSPYRRIYEVLPLGGVLVTLDPYNSGTLQPLALSPVPLAPAASARQFRLREQTGWLDAAAPARMSGSSVVSSSFARIRKLTDR